MLLAKIINVRNGRTIQLTLFELAEADETCHGNWIEIQRLYARIDVLEARLRESSIDILDEILENLPE